MKNENSKYKYYAFISYKREDERWAKWLHKKLESYGFPVALRKENPSLPSKIRPVFRDQSELSGGKLKEAIENGLKDSKYLIVICSPRAAKSPWVSKEVQYFIDHGREEYIIPFIIGGSPNASDPENECFPEGLRSLSGENEILGININEMGRDAAVIKVIARMFDLRFDTLWQRHERTKRRRRLTVIFAVFLLALISFGIGSYMMYLNTRIRAERDRAEKQTVIARQERNRANNEREHAEQQTLLAQAERNRALNVNKALEQAKDSIQFQSNLIIKANRSLEETNCKLEESNRLLIEEQDAKEQAYLATKKNNIRLRMALANQRLEMGDGLTASLLALDALTNDSVPYMPEAEGVLRNAVIRNNAVFDAFYTTPKECKFTNDGNYILSSAENVKIYKVCNGALVKIVPILYPRIKIGNGSIYLADDQNVYELDENWNPVTIRHFNRRISGFVDNSNCVVSYSKNEATLFDMFSGDSVITLKEICSVDGNNLKYSNNGKFVIAALNDSVVGIFNSKNGDRLHELRGHKRNNTDMLFNGSNIDAMFSRNDSIIYSWSTDKTVRIWSSTSWECLDTLFFPSAVNSIAVDRYEEILYAALDNGEIHKYNLKTNEQLSPIIGHTAQIAHVALNRFSNILASVGNDGTMRLWGGNNLESRGKLYGPKSTGTGIVFCPLKGVGRDFVFTATGDPIIYNGEFRWYREFPGFKGHRGQIYSVKFSEDGKRILSTSADSTIRIWQNSGKVGQEIKTFTDSCGAVYDADFISDKRILSISGDGKFRIWSVNEGTCIDSIDATNFISGFDRSAYHAGLKISNDKKYVYILNRKIYKFDLCRKICIDSIGYNVMRYDICSDNSKIVYCNADTLCIRDNVLGQTRFKMVPNSGNSITDVQFSKDGKYLLIAFLDANVEVRDAETGVLLKKYDGTWRALHATFSSTGDKIAVTGGYFNGSFTDNYTEILDFAPLDKLIERQRRRFKDRQLSSEEKRKYYLE